MKAFAELLDQLAYTPSRNDKLRLLAGYFASAPDPERGLALAALTDGLFFRLPLRRILTDLVAARVDPVLFDLSRDYVGDTAETIALIWPGGGKGAKPPRLAAIVEALQSTPPAEIPALLAGWLDHDADLLELVEALHSLYQGGFGELAVALHAAGWRDPGSGMLAPLVDALHGLRPPGSPVDDTRLAVAALHQAMAMEALYGSDFRRSAGFTGETADDPAAQIHWWARQLHLALGLEPAGDRAERRP